MEKLQFKECIHYEEGEVYAHKIFGLELDQSNEIIDDLRNISVNLFLETLRGNESRMVDITAMEQIFEKRGGLELTEYSWLLYNIGTVLGGAKAAATKQYLMDKAAANQKEAEQEAKAATDGKLISLRHRNNDDAKR